MGHRQSHRGPWAASRVTSHISHWPRGSLVWAKPPCNHETTASKRAWNGLEPRLYTTRSQEFVPGTSNTATCLFWVLEPLRPVFFAIERSIVFTPASQPTSISGLQMFQGFWDCDAQLYLDLLVCGATPGHRMRTSNKVAPRAAPPSLPPWTLKCVSSNRIDPRKSRPVQVNVDAYQGTWKPATPHRQGPCLLMPSKLYSKKKSISGEHNLICADSVLIMGVFSAAVFRATRQGRCHTQFPVEGITRNAEPAHSAVLRLHRDVLLRVPSALFILWYKSFGTLYRYLLLSIVFCCLSQSLQAATTCNLLTSLPYLNMSALEKEKLADDGADAETGLSPPIPKSPGSVTSDSNGSIDPVAERKLLWKIDLMLWPVFFVIYVMAFLDRINISHAAIQGMTAELGLDQGNRFNVALFVCRSYSPSQCQSWLG